MVSVIGVRMKESGRRKMNGRVLWINSAGEEEKAGREVKMGVESLIITLHSISHSSDQLPEVHLFSST